MGGSAAIEIVAESQDQHPRHGRRHFPAMTVQRQRTGHHSQPKPANRAWHHEAMLKDSTTERESTK